MKTCYNFFLTAVLCLTAISTFAIDEEDVSKNMRTDAQLYFTAEEANAFLEENATESLFLDVRDPSELNTVGMPSKADANIPFMRVDTNKWDDNRGRFAFTPNTDFVSNIEARLEEKSLDKDAPIILMCGSGVRSARAANVLHKQGFSNVYSLVGGYKDWQMNKLDTDSKLDKNKMWGEID